MSGSCTDMSGALQASLRYDPMGRLYESFGNTSGTTRYLYRVGWAQNQFTAVGDDDQSIYGWRGATIDNLRRLRADGVSAVVVVGLTTEHCVSSTVRMSGDLGFETYVVSDASACFGHDGPSGERFTAEQVHGVSLASLEGEFARVVGTDEILRRL